MPSTASVFAGPLPPFIPSPFSKDKSRRSAGPLGRQEWQTARATWLDYTVVTNTRGGVARQIFLGLPNSIARRIEDEVECEIYRSNINKWIGQSYIALIYQGPGE